MSKCHLKTAIIFLLLSISTIGYSQTYHTSCGTDHAMEKLIENTPSLARQADDFFNRFTPSVANVPRARRAPTNQIHTIPIVVHVIHNGEAVGTGANLSEERISAQIEILNKDFIAQNANFAETPARWADDIGSPNIQFCLATQAPDGSSSNGITRHQIDITGSDIENSNIEDEIKPATVWNPNKYYNVWVLAVPGTNEYGGTTGYAYIPFAGTIGQDHDGTVVDFNWFGGEGFGQSGTGTLTHETGHYLGLRHTFHGNSCGADDNINDTPNIEVATSSLQADFSCSPGNFPTGPSSCGNEHMYVNYMDYVNSDYCGTSFTNGQIAVMRAVLEGNSGNYGSRTTLINNGAVACNTPEKDAGLVRLIAPTENPSCFNNDQITPQVHIRNFGSATINNLSISYQINDNAPVITTLDNTIASGGSAVLELNPFTMPSSSYLFKVYVSSTNGTDEENMSNDSMTIYSIVNTPQITTLNEPFASGTFAPTPNGVNILNPDNDVFKWEYIASVSADGETGGSAFFNNYSDVNGINPTGTSDALITPTFNLQGKTNTSLSFDLAHGPYPSTSDSLKVFVSTNCGASYDILVFSGGGDDIATAPETDSPFTPTNSSQWRRETIDLSAYDNQPELSIAIYNKSGYGNNIYIDNINVSWNTQDCSDLTINPIVNSPSCQSSNNGSIALEITEGNPPYAYQWSTGATSEELNNLEAGTYYVTVLDNQNCPHIDTIILAAPFPISLDLVVNNESAFGLNDGSASVTVEGGTPPYQYDWSNNANTSSIQNLSPGTYWLLVIDANGCEKEQSFEINTEEVDCSSLAVAATSSNPSCHNTNDGSISLATTGGNPPYTYQWNNNQTSADLSNLASGTFTVTISDSQGCTLTETVTLTSPTAIIGEIATVDNQLGNSAPNGSATATVSGGTPPYTYQWSNNATTNSIQNIAGGDYTLTVTDSNVCEWTIAFTIEDIPLDCSDFETSLEAESMCYGEINQGRISTTVSGGTSPYSYQWNTGSTAANLNNIGTGNYMVTISDFEGCSMVQSAQIIEYPVLVVNLNADVDADCATGNTLNLTANTDGGLAPYTYLWNTNATTNSIQVTSSGTYSVTVVDAMGCSISKTENIEFSSAPLFTQLTLEQPTCDGGQNGMASVAAAGGTPPYTYQWSNGNNTNAITGLGAGTYAITVNDANGCEAEEVFTIDNPVSFTLNCTGSFNDNNQTGTAQVSVNGGAPPYTYSWSTGATSAYLLNIPLGVYGVTITDQNGCQASCNVNLYLTNTEDISTLESLDIYPNPVQDVLNIQAEFSQNTQTNITILNILGQRFWETTTNGDKINQTVDLSKYPSGTYFIQIESDKGSLTKKIILL